MLSLVDKNPIMETNSQKLSNNNKEAAELLGLSSSDSLDSPSFTHFQAQKQKRKVRFKKPFRSHSRLKSSRIPSSKGCQCSFVEGLKMFSYFAMVAIVCALLWYVMTLSTRIQELQAKFSDFEAGNRNTPEALHVIHSSLKQLDSNVTNIYIDVRKNIADLENITNEVKALKDTAGSLKASIASAPALEQLPKDMHSLSESVANFGSKLTALESNVKEFKDQQSNLQTTAQNLSGELDTLKVKLEDLTNSSDIQAKSSVNTSVKDFKLQNSIQETNLQVNNLQEQLTYVVKSFGKINATYNSVLNNYGQLPNDVKTVKDAIFWINNSTISQNSRLLALETFIHSNLSLLLEQMEPEKLSSFKKSGNMEAYVNRTISETLLHLINKDILHTNSQNSNNNSVQSLEQTHDVLVLLAALLQKFAQIPQTFILNYENATELVQGMLQQAFEGMIALRDVKIEDMEQKIQNLTLCIPPNHISEGNVNNLSTPVFVQSTSKSESILKENSQMQLAEALG